MEIIKIEKYKLLEFVENWINENLENETEIKAKTLNDHQLMVLYMLISYNFDLESLNDKESAIYQEFMKITSAIDGTDYINFIVADYIISFITNGSISGYGDLLDYLNNLLYDYNKMIVEYEGMEIL